MHRSTAFTERKVEGKKLTETSLNSIPFLFALPRLRQHGGGVAMVTTLLSHQVDSQLCGLSCCNDRPHLQSHLQSTSQRETEKERQERNSYHRLSRSLIRNWQNQLSESFDSFLTVLNQPLHKFTIDYHVLSLNYS